MPKKKRIEKTTDTVVDDAELARIEVMAKLAVARASAAALIESLDEAISYFIDPSGDKKGEKRADAIETAAVANGEVTIALEYIGDRLSDVDTELGEDFDEDDDDEDEEEDEDDDGDDEEDDEDEDDED